MKRKIKLLKSVPVNGEWKARHEIVEVPIAEASNLVAIGKAECVDVSSKATDREPKSDAGRNTQK